MKLLLIALLVCILLSPPSRGAWIEINNMLSDRKDTESPPSRGAWIEISIKIQDFSGNQSPPSRGGVD